MRQDVNNNFSDAAEKEMLTGFTPTGDEEEDDEAEMVSESQRRMSSDQQVSFEHDVQRILSTSTFQTMSPTVDADDDDEAEGRKNSTASIQVIFKSDFLKNAFNFSDEDPNWGWG